LKEKKETSPLFYQVRELNPRHRIRGKWSSHTKKNAQKNPEGKNAEEGESNSAWGRAGEKGASKVERKVTQEKNEERNRLRDS